MELGWEKYAMMMFLTWEAQWLNYVEELHRNLTEPALVIPVYDRVTMLGSAGAIANISIEPDIWVCRQAAGAWLTLRSVNCPTTSRSRLSLR